MTMFLPRTTRTTFGLELRGLHLVSNHGDKNVRLEGGFRADMIVNNRLITELKSVLAVAPVHHLQLKTYLKLSGIPNGLLVNFNCANLYKEGLFLWKTD